MTHSPAEIDLSPEAVNRLEEYLTHVRSALAGTADVNADEIVADIREHVENELRSAPRPVPLAALEAVLTRLGPPSQWGTTNDPTLLHRARHLLREKLQGAKTSLAEQLRGAKSVVWRGPEDWRLPYLSFGIFALGILTFFALFPFTLIVSYFLSRAGIAYAREQGIALGTARKWLLYPPVVLVSAALLIAVVLWPPVLGGVAFEQVERARERVARFDRSNPPARPAARRNLAREEHQELEAERRVLAAIPTAPDWAPLAAGLFVGGGALAIWWTLLGVIGATFPGAVRAVFCPLCDRFERHHGTWLAVVCAILLIPWGLTAYEVIVALL